VREPWFRIRTPLSAGRRTLLMVASFVLPVLLWCVVTYTPAFQTEMRLTLVTEKIGDGAAFAPGDRVAKSYFGTLQDNVREVNAGALAERAAGTASGSSRANKKKLRQLTPLARTGGHLDGIDDGNFKAIDAALFGLYGRLASGELDPRAFGLSDENAALVRANWELLKEAVPYGEKDFVKKPLQYLIPQGKSASPVFLPPPGECLAAAWKDFTTEPPNGQPWMHQRLLSSLKVVFGAFLLACLVGVPIGLLCGTSDFFAKLIEPFVDFFRYMPAPTFGLLLQAMFGVAGAPKLALVFIGTFPHLVLMLGNTTRGLDRSLVEAAQTLGAKPGRLFKNVIVPGVLPRMYGDLRVLLGWAWTWLVIAELIGEKTGLTAFIDTQGGKYNFDRVFPVIIMIGIIGFTTDQLLQSLARVLFPWEFAGGRGWIGRMVSAPSRLLGRGLAWTVDRAGRPGPRDRVATPGGTDV